ncbi:hypothetical protein BC629DRAFT_630534 [Irpex lacteus]|nr:hypothetical protein BC629DRAFT_630534 [Irpex lacteus]
MVHPTRADKYYVECANLDGQAYAAVGQLYQHSVAQDNTTKQSLNTIIFTAVVLLSPLWSMSQLPTVAVNPILRIGTYAACISCVTAMVIGIILRVRLKFVTQSQATDTKGRPNKQTIMSASAVPLALLLRRVLCTKHLELPTDLRHKTAPLPSLSSFYLVLHGMQDHRFPRTQPTYV